MGASLWLATGSSAWAQQEAASELLAPLDQRPVAPTPAPSEPPPSHPVPGVSAVEVRVALPGSFTGASAAFSAEALRGSLAWLNEVNATGGVGGRQIKLLAQDDGGESARTVHNLLRVLDDPGVFCLLNQAGARTLPSLLPVLHGQRETGLVLVGHNSGGELPRSSLFAGQVFTLGASGGQQVQALAERMQRHGNGEGARKIERLGVYGPLDGRGRSVVAAVHSALAGDSIQVIEATFDRHGAPAPPLAVLERFADLDALIVCGAVEPCTALIERLAGELANRLMVGCVALDDHREFARRLSALQLAGPVVSVRPVPSLTRRDLPAVDDYIRLTQRWQPRVAVQLGGSGEPSQRLTTVGFEAFLATRLFTLALERCGTWPTRQKLYAALESFSDVDLGLDVPVSLGSMADGGAGHQALKSPYLSLLSSGRWQDFDPISRIEDPVANPQTTLDVNSELPADATPGAA